MVFFKREAPSNMSSIDISSYNLKDPADIQKFFLANHAELMSMYSQLTSNLDTISTWIHTLDLLTLEEKTLSMMLDINIANLQVHQTIVEFFQGLVKFKHLSLLNP